MSSNLAPRLVKLQRAYQVRFYVGRNGGGKTASAVGALLPSLAAGRPVLSNVRILDYENPRPCDSRSCWCRSMPDDRKHGAKHPLYTPLTKWRQVVEAEHCDILCDEVSTMLSSRDVGGLPSEVEAVLQQCRKPDVTFTATAPAYGRADKVLRDVMQLVVFCKPSRYFRTRAADADRIWYQNRLFRQSGYDAAELEAFENGKRDKVPILWQGFWWGPGSPRFEAYDTYEAVPLMGARANRGPCIECGLKRSGTIATCKGHDGIEDDLEPSFGALPPRRLLEPVR